MRILHLYFQLHLPHQLNLSGKHKTDLFQDAATFARANETEYQPFFALLERNRQKFPEFKISLGVSGQWFDQAEKYDPELIQRLKKLIDLGCVQIIAMPYDFSLAWFYNQDEFETQMQLWGSKIRDYFGIACSIFAMPELMYNDKIAKWAEEAGYSGVIIGEAESILDWRTPNRVYDAKGCKDLRLVCQNTKFSSAIMRAKNAILEVDNKTKQTVFSLPKFQKELGLEFLRGDLISLCLDSSIFRRFREQGIIKFFDNLIADWLAISQNRFYNALETIGSSQPKNEISIKTTITRCNFTPKNIGGIIPIKKVRYSPPEGLNSTEQTKFEETLYALRSQVQKTQKEEIIRDFSRLTALDYIMNIDGAGKDDIVKLPSFAELSEILTNFGQKVFSMMPRPAQLETKAGPGRTEPPQEADDFSVKVCHVKAKPKTKNAEETQAEKKADNVEKGKKAAPKKTIKPATSPAPDTIFGGVTFDDPEGLGSAPDKPPRSINDEDIALDKHGRIEVDLSDLPEAEIIEQQPSEQKQDTSAKKRTKRRRVVIE